MPDELVSLRGRVSTIVRGSCAWCDTKNMHCMFLVSHHEALGTALFELRNAVCR